MGPGFRSTTRVAATSASIMLDVLKTNRNYVLENLARFRIEIDKLEKLLVTEDFDTLEQQLIQRADRHRSLAMPSSDGEI